MHRFNISELPHILMGFDKNSAPIGCARFIQSDGAYLLYVMAADVRFSPEGGVTGGRTYAGFYHAVAVIFAPKTCEMVWEVYTVT